MRSRGADTMYRDNLIMRSGNGFLTPSNEGLAPVKVPRVLDIETLANVLVTVILERQSMHYFPIWWTNGNVDCLVIVTPFLFLN